MFSAGSGAHTLVSLIHSLAIYEKVETLQEHTPKSVKSIEQGDYKVTDSGDEGISITRARARPPDDQKRVSTNICFDFYHVLD